MAWQPCAGFKASPKRLPRCSHVSTSLHAGPLPPTPRAAARQRQQVLELGLWQVGYPSWRGDFEGLKDCS